MENKTGRTLQAVSLRWRQGGPTIIQPAAVAPNSWQVLRIHLPAAWPEQMYDVTFLDGPPGASAGVAKALSITWPVELVADGAFIDPAAYEPYRGTFPAWPATLRKRLFLAAAALSLIAAATLLLRRPAARLAALAAVILLAGAAATAAMLHQPIVQHLEANRDAGEFHVITSRRTTRWHTANAPWAPIYESRRQLSADTMTLTNHTTLSVLLHPHQVRLFRAVKSSTGRHN